MQIKNIVLYKDSNTSPRILPFSIGKVNIITGESKTGKTALIDIIDYCLGSTSCNIKGAVIRSTVKWFAITLQFDNDQIFIARQNPEFLNTNTTGNIYFKYGDEVSIPHYDEITINSNVSALNKFLSNKLGIDTNLNIPDNNTRDSLEASFRHSRLFSFQPQNVIAEYKYLFFNQDDSFVKMAIKDTMPYILGAIREDELVIQQKITIKKRKLNQLIRDKKQEELIKSKSIGKLSLFIDEAIRAELIDKEYHFESEKDAIKKLRTIDIDDVDLSPLAENEQLEKLINKRSKLNIKVSHIDSEISAIEEFSVSSQNYVDEVFSQKDRLLSVGLYKEPSDNRHWNSIIGEETDYLSPSIKQINKSLIELEDSLHYTEQHKPKVQKILLELNNKKISLNEEITSTGKLIKNIYKENKQAEKYKNININKGRTIGRISLFLESIEESDENSTLSIQIEATELEIEKLEGLVSKDEKEEKLNAIFNKINILMTSWNDLLDWEYQKSNLRFDIKKLTVFADTDEKSESLQQMGSGENWLACHLFIHFALHKHFIDKKRPVANFIVFDQPTQIHYPKNYQEGNDVFIQSEDEKADEKMFKFILSITKGLSPDLQVIVTDHANFSNQDFQDCVVEEWRNGKKLVPVEWL